MSRDVVRCDVCPHECQLYPTQIGKCGVRVGVDGAVVPDSRQAIAAVGVQPVEEHPLYHFRPGIRTLCVGSVGCTAACGYCQNWELALAPRMDRSWHVERIAMQASDVVGAALRHGCEAVSFTYNEMLVWREAMLEITQAARASGLSTIWISNGFATRASLASLMPLIDAVKIDLKGWDRSSSMRLAGIDVAYVREFVTAAEAAGVWIESSIVVGMPEYAEPSNRFRMIDFVIEQLGLERPLHLQRFFPAHRRSQEPFGNIDLLQQFRREAIDRGMRYVYISNVPGLSEADTFCPSCTTRLSRRAPDRHTRLTAECTACGTPVPGVGLAREIRLRK